MLFHHDKHNPHSCEGGHHHSHAHHHHAIDIATQGRTLVFCIAVNLLFVFTEAFVGHIAQSVSLLSDAGHNLSDVLSLALVVVAFRLEKVRSNRNITYGYRKSTVLISLLNALLLLGALIMIVVESVERLESPTALSGEAITWTALAGIFVNGITAYALMAGQKTDINMRGAYLHMVADTAVSAGVVVSGIVISLTGWTIIDPLISLLIAVVIAVSTWRLLSYSLLLIMDGTPKDIDISRVEQTILEQSHVRGVHHIHVWAISTTAYALTGHIVVDELGNMEAAKRAVHQALNQMGIRHVTIETETPDSHCQERECCL